MFKIISNIYSHSYFPLFVDNRKLVRLESRRSTYTLSIHQFGSFGYFVIGYKWHVLRVLFILFCHSYVVWNACIYILSLAYICLKWICFGYLTYSFLKVDNLWLDGMWKEWLFGKFDICVWDVNLSHCVELIWWLSWGALEWYIG